MMDFALNSLFLRETRFLFFEKIKLKEKKLN